MSDSNLMIGIDASRIRTGGGKAHLIGILRNFDPDKHTKTTIHIWSSTSLLDTIPDKPWLIKHSVPALERSLAKQLMWQAFCLSKALAKIECDILFTTDASTLCRFKPMVLVSQDMLCYEHGVMSLFGFSIARLRLLIILSLQNWALLRANGVIFLTKYAACVIQKTSGKLKNFSVIPHAANSSFKKIKTKNTLPLNGTTIRCIYISPIWEFKHQWVVVKAIELLRKNGYDISIQLIGDMRVDEGKILKVLNKQIIKSDPNGEFVEYLRYVPRNKLPYYFSKADIFIFASSCEAFGITLLEAMSCGLPIACSNRSSMPETLQDGGIYFNPEDENSIAAAVSKIVKNNQLRLDIANRAKELSEQYSWKRCSEETFEFVINTHQGLKISLNENG